MITMGAVICDIAWLVFALFAVVVVIIGIDTAHT